MCTLTAHPGVVYSVAFSPDGTRVCASGDKLVKIWDAATGAEVRSFLGVRWGCNNDGVGVLGGFAQVRSGSWTEERVRWQVRTLTGHWDSVYSVDFSPDGKWIVSGSADKLVKIWDAEPGAEVRSFVEVR